MKLRQSYVRARKKNVYERQRGDTVSDIDNEVKSKRVFTLTLTLYWGMFANKQTERARADDKQKKHRNQKECFTCTLPHSENPTSSCLRPVHPSAKTAEFSIHIDVLCKNLVNKSLFVFKVLHLLLEYESVL